MRSSCWAIATCLHFVVVGVGSSPANDNPDLHVKRVMQIKSELDDKEMVATFMLHTFADYTGIQNHTDPTLPRRPRRSGFAVSVAYDDDAESTPRLLWSRPYVMIPIPGGPDWEPVVNDVATLWWDERTSTLWMAFAVTTKRTSLVNVHRLAMVRDKDTGALAAGEGDIPTFERSFHHPRGEPDRIVTLEFMRDKDEDVILRLNRQDEESEPLDVPISQDRMRTISRNFEVEGLETAIRNDFSKE